MKRNQYTWADFNPPASTRQVPSAACDTGAVAVVTILRKFSSSATSTNSLRTLASPARVQRITFLSSGSPEATPSGNRSRRSLHFTAGSLAGFPHAATGPIAAALRKNDPRVFFKLVHVGTTGGVKRVVREQLWRSSAELT